MSENIGKSKFRRFIYRISGILIIVAYPLMLLLLISPNIGFYDNWYENLWVIGFYGEFFRQHLGFPNVLSIVSGSVSMVMPIFYGFTLYPLLGMVSAVVGSDLTARLTLYALFLAQFMAVKLLIGKISGNRFYSYSLAVLVTYAIYPLTNIYNRGALPEVYSGLFLTISVLLWFYLLLERKLSKKLSVAIVFAFCITMSVGVWPPTFIQGAIVYFIMSVLTFIFLRGHLKENKNTLILLFLSLIYFSLVLLPWLYVTPKFAYNFWNTDSGHDIAYYPKAMDMFPVRFSPFPVDIRSVMDGLKVKEGTPYLDAQMNSPLFALYLILLIILIKNRKQAGLGLSDKFNIFITAALFLYFTAMSLSPVLTATLPGILSTIHFHYRFVTYMNIAVLIGVITLLTIVSRLKMTEVDTKIIFISLIVLLSLSSQSVLIKNLHGASIMSFNRYPFTQSNFGISNSGRDGLLNQELIPGYFYAYRDVKSYPKLPDGDVFQPATGVIIPVSGGKDFGNLPASVNFSLNNPEWIYTNISAFPWNRIMLDGNELSAKDIYLPSGGDGVVLHVSVGTHTLGVRFVPDDLWKILKNISYLSLLVGYILTIIIILKNIYLKLKQS